MEMPSHLLLEWGLGNAAAAGLLALGAALGEVVFRRRPAVRHALWLLVLLKLVTPPLWTWEVGGKEGIGVFGPEPGASMARATTRDDPVELETSHLALPDPDLDLDLDLDLDPDAAEEMAGSMVLAEVLAAQFEHFSNAAAVEWGRWLILAWGLGTAVTFAVAGSRIRRFQRLLVLAEPADASTCAEVAGVAARLGMSRPPTVRMVTGPVSPMVWAVGCRPTLIVPEPLWKRLDTESMATLLAHELAHLKRRDHWVRGLELLVTGLYWWFPLVWLARWAVRAAEEECCDAWVVWSFPGAARTYAEALLETLDFLAGAVPPRAASVAASGLGPVSHLKRRMTMILRGSIRRQLSWGGLLAVMSGEAVLLPMAPSWAQRPEVEVEFKATAETPRDIALDKDKTEIAPPAEDVFRFEVRGETVAKLKEAIGKAQDMLESLKESDEFSPEFKKELGKVVDQLQERLALKPGSLELQLRKREARERARPLEGEEAESPEREMKLKQSGPRSRRAAARFARPRSVWPWPQGDWPRSSLGFDVVPTPAPGLRFRPAQPPCGSFPGPTRTSGSPSSRPGSNGSRTR